MRLLIRRQLTRRNRSARHAARQPRMMENAKEPSLPPPAGKGIVAKRISASAPDAPAGKSGAGETPEGTRTTVIRRAPPRGPPEGESAGGKRRKTEGSSPGVILIGHAIAYRIVDILMWKVMGETRLKSYGYPFASTRQLLWRIVHRSAFPSGAEKQQENPLAQDHDCGGNLNCFASHVYRFLEMCAPNLWTRTGWDKLSVEDVLRRIYYEDLIPYLRSVDLRNSLNVLQCHSDIVLLEKWEKQKFTAVTWSGENYLSQVSVNCPRCPQCSNRHF